MLTPLSAELVQALESYSSHLEPDFVRVALPPTAPNQSVPPTFDLSDNYVESLDDEFTRVYEEYTARVEKVKAFAEEIIQLWAELGTPQVQTDAAIVKYYRDAPEQLGLHEEDLTRLQTKRDKLSDEKKNREKRLANLKTSVEELWEKLGVEEPERKAFLNSNRGCGVRQINEFEDELARLNELKRENMHLFVEDARYKLQELWDALYFSEDEMLEFTPAFSDVYSDALLEAHEREIARLEALREQRAPTLELVEKHRTLVQERDELAQSSQDASRLMMRGQKGEKRDPGKLLREEKMRKRIAKELPKVAAELRKVLEDWEEEYGRPFLVHGESYIEMLDVEEAKAGAGARSKTPAGPPASARKPGLPARAQSTITRSETTMSRNGTVGRSNTVNGTIGRSETAMGTLGRSDTAIGTLGRSDTVSSQNGTLSRTGTLTRSKTPNLNLTGGGTLRRGQLPPTPGGERSPSRLPARAPLSNLTNGGNSPERVARPQSRAQGVLRQGPPLMRAPPPKMRELVPAPQLETPTASYNTNSYKSNDFGSSVRVRAVEPEDVYVDNASQQSSQLSYSRSHTASASTSSFSSAGGQSDRLARSDYPQAPQAPPPRVVSGTSTIVSGVSGSENWETYDDTSEPEEDISDTYYAKVRQAPSKRFTPEDPYSQLQANQTKRIRGLPPAMHAGPGIVDAEGNRTISGSEWADDDPY